MNISLSSNLIYGIHTSYYSVTVGIFLLNLFMIVWVLFNYGYLSIYALPVYYFFIWILNFSNQFYVIVSIVYLIIMFWLVDMFIESIMSLTLIEQLLLMSGIKLLLLSELMLFFACFWCYINYRLVGTVLLLFYFALYSSLAFSVPFSNLLILFFSSLPLQNVILSLNIGVYSLSIEGYIRFILCGFLFLILQYMEFCYAFFSISLGIIGSVYFFTIGLHGTHVLLGLILFYLIFYLVFCGSY